MEGLGIEFHGDPWDADSSLLVTTGAHSGSIFLKLSQVVAPTYRSWSFVIVASLYLADFPSIGAKYIRCIPLR
jgi:hypothetical protein